MAQMMCQCGERLSNVMFPNEMEGNLTGSYEYKSRDVWECLACGRLHIDTKDDNGLDVSKSYIPEDGKPGMLFKEGTPEEYYEKLKEDCNLSKPEILAMMKNTDASFEEWLETLKEIKDFGDAQK